MNPDTKTFAPVSSPWSTDAIGLPTSSRIAVVGAGAFGGWSALFLQRAGYHVTLIDAWGAGNSRSSSGDETRVIRSTYGANRFYFDLNVRALTLWKEHQERWRKKVFFNTGVLWFCYDEKNPIVDDSLPFAEEHRMPYEYLSRDQLKTRFPLVHTDDLHHAWFDPFGGYLKARESCAAVLDMFVAEGGTFIPATVKPIALSERIDHLELSSGQTLSTDAYLFACGAWLGSLFPEAYGERITCTKQEVYYFGAPSSTADAFDQLPAWIDLDGHHHYYGIAGNAHRGFKIGVDERGERFDPTIGERILTPSRLATARTFLAHRFPALRQAPLLESRVCPYENSPDGNFIFERHPALRNTWILGGGSGHGFKHGPALGERIAQLFS